MLIQRGAYLAVAADCAACHRSATGATQYGGGLAINSPVGKIIASNITPSVSGGIGSFTEEDFRRALKEGIGRGGTPLYPAMPYTAYRNLTDDDVRALYAYFMNAVPPDDRRPPATRLDFPFSIRTSMRVWNALFLDDGREVKPLSPQLERGRYLVDALGHCSACHSPRNWLMAEDNRKRYLSGGAVDGWYAPNITSDPDVGIGSWTQAELAQYLRSGHVRNKAQAAGPMAEAVEYSLRFLDEADLNAIAAYLKQTPEIGTPDAGGSSLPAQRSNAAPLPVDASISVPGAALYASACASCHRMAGQGAYDGYFPSLIRNADVRAVKPNNLVMTILYGVERRGDNGQVWMPAFGQTLNDAQVADLANYVSMRFGRRMEHVSADDVATLRNGGPTPVIAWLPYVLATFGALFVVALGYWVLVVRGRRARRDAGQPD
ncbi:cytochrome c [Paraburkholderia bannensis]|uniref:cytochrome c n=1 Tax=Paraburkholderia bannensis TaxID=765414 RepID=UPI000694C6AB|nr:cytochrome c [Paraburkholderia bannensis]